VNEVRNWIGLAHPHVVRAFDVIDDQSTDYLPVIFMDYCDGGSLAGWIYSGEALTLAEGLGVAIQVCWAMEYVHEQGLVHRDLKSQNVLLAREGSGRLGKALVTDLGVARALGARGMEPPGQPDAEEAALWVTVSQAGGTPSHMPPEQWEAGSRIGRASDVYAFGVMLYELFCRRLPFQCGNSLVRWKRAHREEAVPDPRRFSHAVQDELATLMMECLAKEPDARPKGFGELDERLSKLYLYENGGRGSRTKPIKAELTIEARRAHAWSKLRLGLGAHRRGDLQVAEREFKEAEQIFRTFNERAGVATSLANRALVLQISERWEDGMLLLKEAEAVFRESNNNAGLAVTLSQQSSIFQALNRLDDALRALREVEELGQQLENQVLLGRSLYGQALIFRARGNSHKR
jgi:serine/threonine protein kinase